MSQKDLKRKYLPPFSQRICSCRLVSSIIQMLYVYFSIAQRKPLHTYSHHFRHQDTKHLLCHIHFGKPSGICAFFLSFSFFLNREEKDNNNSQQQWSIRSWDMCMCSMNNTNKRLDYGINFQHIIPTICIVLNKYFLCKWICFKLKKKMSHLFFRV